MTFEAAVFYLKKIFVTFLIHTFFLQEDNRYKVKKGLKFYRVKIQMLKGPNHRREISTSDSSSVSVTYVQ